MVFFSQQTFLMLEALKIIYSMEKELKNHQLIIIPLKAFIKWEKRKTA